MESFGRSIKNNKSVGYYMLFLVIALMTVFFFTSRLLLPDDTPILNTQIGQPVPFGKTSELVLERWEYNSVKNFMEVEVGIENFAEILEKEIKIEAITRKDTKKSLPIEVKLQTNDKYVLKIKNLPEDYHTVGLRFSFEEVTESGSGETAEQSTEKNEAMIYADYRKIKVNDKLKEKSKTEYLRASIEREIENTEKDIKDLDEKIEKNIQEKYALNRSITTLNEEMKYQIESEKQKTIGTINRYETKKSDLERENEQIRMTQEELGNKRDKLEEKLLSIEK